jgi:uncharacterized membrane protein YeaQ/YmgE (transglycosylase-associated protein family)
MALITFLIFGLIVGFLARALMPGPDPMSWWMTGLLGIGGSFIGWGIGRAVGLYHNALELRPAGIVMSLVGAMLLLLVVRAVRRRQHHAGDVRP